MDEGVAIGSVGSTYNPVLGHRANTLLSGIRIRSKVVYRVSWFVTMISYGGGREIERTMVTQETQGFLDRFMHPRG
jgi:hypothetical protein